MNEIQLKYGCNPNQKPARVFMKDGSDLPFEVLNGKPGYINLLDAFNSWQLVKEVKEATGHVAAASFKHVSPAGAAVAVPLTDILQQVYFVEGIQLSPIATAYIRELGRAEARVHEHVVALRVPEAESPEEGFVACREPEGRRARRLLRRARPAASSVAGQGSWLPWACRWHWRQRGCCQQASCWACGSAAACGRLR